MKLLITVCNKDTPVIVLDLDTGKETRIPADNQSPGRVFGITYDAKRIYLASQLRFVSYNKTFGDGKLILSKGIGTGHSFHQVLYHDKMLWLTSTRTNGLYRITPDKTNEQHFFLNQKLNLVVSEDRQIDNNHINSIFINEKHLYISCHNKTEPSFILKFKYPALTYVDQMVLGRQIHNLLVCPKRIWTLDSGGTRSLISTKEDQIKLGNKNHFLRGLCATSQWFIAGKFAFNEKQKDRWIGDSEILMISRKNRKIEHKFILKDTGEINDMRLMDTYDECHGMQPIW